LKQNNSSAWYNDSCIPLWGFLRAVMKKMEAFRMTPILLTSRWLVVLCISGVCFASHTAISQVFDANSATINNRYSPFAVGQKWSLRGTGQLEGEDVIDVECTTIEEINGIKCLRTDASNGYSEWFAQV